MTLLRKAVFLDRDGVLNPDVGYPHRIADAVLFPDVVPALLRLQRAGYALVVVSNQSGVARGHFGLPEVHRFNRALATSLREAGIAIQDEHFFICPHGPDDGCDCRKPKPGLLLRAQRDLGLHMDASFLVGDSESDVRAGIAAGVTTILVNRGNKPAEIGAQAVVRDLLEAAAIIGG